jgi:hypothetical protein
MIIHIVDINGMAVIEAERNTPIPGDRYSPIARKASLERMQAEPRNVHIIRPAAAVQYRKNIAKFFNMRRGHPSCRSSIIKGFEPTMFKRLNHVKVLYPSCVACQLTRNRLGLRRQGQP